jgi:predicted porin
MTALTSAFAASSAMATDVTVYGRLHLSADQYDDGLNSAMFLASNSSRLGFKAAHEIRPGLTVMGQLESGIDGTGNGGPDGNGGGGFGGTGGGNSLMTNARDTFVGLSGAFGSVKFGRLGWANQYVYDVNFFGDQVGDAGAFTENGTPGGRRNKQIQYATPNFNGFQATLGYVPENDTATTQESDLSIRLTYGIGPVWLGYTQIETGSDSVAQENETQAFAVTYNFGMGSVGAMLVTGENNNVDKADVITIGGSVNLGGGALKAQYTKADETVAGANDGGNMFAIGYDYPIASDATVYVAYARVDNDDATTAFSPVGYGHGGLGGPAQPVSAFPDNDPSVISIGLVYSFNM